MEVDILLLMWFVMNGGCFVVVLLYLFKEHIPVCFHGFFQWGKTETNVNTMPLFNRLLHVPNSWFTHFYMVGVLWSVALLYSLCTLCNNLEHSTSLLVLFSSLLTPASHYSYNSDCISVMIGLGMLLIQVSRRLLECLCISVFTGRIHLAHYMVGIVFYILAGSSMVAPLQDISTSGWCMSCQNILHNLNWTHLIAGSLFTWASLHQHRCHVILAKLRPPSNDKNTRVYKIPQGDWFEYVSSPHYFAEILIYFSFVVLQKGKNIYLWLMLVFVVQNLSLGATVTQNWYQNKFKEYSRKRLKIIPFVF